VGWGWPPLDRASDWSLIPRSLTGTPTAAQTTLSTIATAMMSLAILVLTVTLVAIQLAMGQFSPRVVRALLQDRRNQAAIGLFTATFAYAVLAVRAVDDEAGRVPGLTVVVAYLLVLASLAGLVLYVHHAGQSLRASGLIDLVGDETRRQLQRLYPGPGPGEAIAGDRHLIAARRPGVIVHIDHPSLVAVAQRAGVVLELLPAMGDFVPTGAAVFRIHGEPAGVARDEVAGHILLGPERTHTEEPAYGLRKLVDIAERGIAQPFLDPTTTVMAIHRLHDCLRLLAARPFPSGRHCDAAGNVRLLTRTMEWGGYVRLAFDELRLAGAGSPQVTRRLRAALEDLRTVAPPERHPPLDRQLKLLDAGVRRAYDDGLDVEAALTADQQGIGSGLDLRPAPADGATAAPADGAAAYSRS
jgi:uncharacterized membrane protein